MTVDRRSWLARLGGVAAAAWLSKANAQTSAHVEEGLKGFNPAKVRERANADGDFLRAARYWDATLRLEIAGHPYHVVIQKGSIAEFAPARGASKFDVKVAGPIEPWSAWTKGFATSGLTIEGDQVGHIAPYQGAILRLIGLIREEMSAPAPETPIADVDRPYDAAVGRYVYVRIQGVQYRVYYEESGAGIPMVLQHTAGADGREWRHLLEDTDLQKKYRMIAYDLPFHGKSVPPAGVRWWAQEYRLTRDLVMDSIIAISQAVKADRPVYMGCSVGGYLAPDLAYYHPDKFRAVIGVNPSIAGSAVFAKLQNRSISDGAVTQYNPRVNGEYNGASMYRICSPTAPEAYRRETAWLYSQGGPGIFAGDLYYYTKDHDLTGGLAEKIDTSKIDVYLVSGEFDPSNNSGPSGGAALQAKIKGSEYVIIPGGSHFAMCDNYPGFKKTVAPILDKVYAKHHRTTFLEKLGLHTTA